MTSRERWTVYPLLLLSIGLALRARVPTTVQAMQVSSQSIECNELECYQLNVRNGAVLRGQVHFDSLHIDHIFIRMADGKEVPLLLSTSDGSQIRIQGTANDVRAAEQPQQD